MISATNDDRQRFVQSVLAAKNGQELLNAVDKIWKDGYRCGEAETQLQIIGERPKNFRPGCDSN